MQVYQCNIKHGMNDVHMHMQIALTFFLITAYIASLKKAVGEMGGRGGVGWGGGECGESKMREKEGGKIRMI